MARESVAPYTSIWTLSTKEVLVDQERLRRVRVEAAKRAREKQPRFARGTEKIPSIAPREVRDNDKALPRIARNLKILDNLLQDLLDLAALDAARFELHRQSTELGELVADVVERMVSSRERGRVQLCCDHAVLVTADAPRIARVVANLVQRALSSSPRNARVSVYVRIISSFARVSIVDDGAPLTPDEARFLLEKFRRGVELTLYVSRRIIEAHDGRLGLESTGLYFELPVA